jgi:hypothetical protein
MLITSLDFSALQVVSLLVVWRGVLKKVCQFHCVKEMVLSWNQIKIILLKVLVVKSSSSAGDICAIVGVEGFEMEILSLILKIRSFKTLLMSLQWVCCLLMILLSLEKR